jgi:general stress protein 26
MGKKRDEREDGEREVRKLRKFIRGTRIAMFTTVAPDGHLRSRPMATLKAEFDGSLWFFTRAGAPKADEIRDNGHVNVVYSDPEEMRFVSVSGRAALVTDRARIESLWSGRLKAWFPEGKSDPELALIRVRIERAEYWNAKSGTMVHALGLGKALGQGEPGGAGADEKRLETPVDDGVPPANPGAAG